MQNNLYTNNYVDVAKLVIWADDVAEEGGKRPRLIFGFRDGNPRITVYTGVQGAGGVIAFPSDYPTMVGIINILKDVIAAPPGTKFSIDSLTTVYTDNKPTNEKKVVGTLYIGKSKEGLVYFSVISENKPKLVFTIKPSPFHVFRDSEKNVIPNDKISCKLATGLAELILNIVSDVILNYTHEEYNGVRKPTPVKSGQQQSSNNTSTQATADMIQDLDDLGL